MKSQRNDVFKGSISWHWSWEFNITKICCLILIIKRLKRLGLNPMSM